MYCGFCKKKHEDFNWKTQEDKKEKQGYIWICSKYFTPSRPEFVPDRIKEDRKKYAKDILQPWRSGEASREFIDAYPERSKKLFTKKEIATAKKVWS